MKIKKFKVEQWMDQYENNALYNIAETCVDSLSLAELFSLIGDEQETWRKNVLEEKLTYGYIQGLPAYKEGISHLYKTIAPEHVISTHGAIGANHLLFYSLIQPTDQVISVQPTYQQLYSIPESFGAKVDLLPLRPENSFLPDLNELQTLIHENTKLICLNNPNNPSGALMPEEMLWDIIEMADKVNAYILCDEVYRGLNQQEHETNSMADMYTRGISVGSMSKVFSLAGLRLGWIATKDQEVIANCLQHRDYTMISCSMLDEMVAALALQHADVILRRNTFLVQQNLALLDAWVNQQPHISYIKPQAGTTALLYYDFDIPSQEFCTALYHKTSVLLTPGSCFELEHCVRIGYACATEVLYKGLAQLGEYLATL